MKSALTAIAITTAGLLASCAPGIVVPDGPPAYRQGYDNGCSSGYFDAGNSAFRFQKDTARIIADADYAAGWKDGYENCRRWPFTF